MVLDPSTSRGRDPKFEHSLKALDPLAVAERHTLASLTVRIEALTPFAPRPSLGEQAVEQAVETVDEASG
jgi:hypothetical protein